MHPKAKAAAQGGTSGAALAVVLAWLAGKVGLDLPQEVAAAFGSLVSTTTAGLAAYFKRT